MGSIKRYKMKLQYEGTRYKGFQRQESTDNTIQGKLEKLLSQMTNDTVEIQASGRTDAGVHALGQIVSVSLKTEMQPKEIAVYMNTYLPEDIAVISVEEVEERFHARLNAKGKTYLYRVRNTETPDVFSRRYVHMVSEKLNLEAMKKGAELLQGTHDFKAFTSAKKSKKSTIRTIASIQIEQVREEIQFTFTGNGFLYHMVRIIVGTLLEIGLGKRETSDITRILESGVREDAGELVPAKGLLLVEVYYEEELCYKYKI